ncbi:ketol-acid reductoisomerase, partial [Nitrospirota bacterium]
TKKEMKKILGEIQDGSFARDWLLECKVGKPSFNALTKMGEEHQIEEVGGRLRGMMPWLQKKKKLVDKSKA